MLVGADQLGSPAPVCQPPSQPVDWQEELSLMIKNVSRKSQKLVNTFVKTAITLGPKGACRKFAISGLFTGKVRGRAAAGPTTPPRIN